MTDQTPHDSQDPRDALRALRTEISKKVGVSPKSIDAYMIGEHGFSQLAAFKAASASSKMAGVSSKAMKTWQGALSNGVRSAA